MLFILTRLLCIACGILKITNTIFHSKEEKSQYNALQNNYENLQKIENDIIECLKNKEYFKIKKYLEDNHINRMHNCTFDFLILKMVLSDKESIKIFNFLQNKNIFLNEKLHEFLKKELVTWELWRILFPKKSESFYLFKALQVFELIQSETSLNSIFSAKKIFLKILKSYNMNLEEFFKIFFEEWKKGLILNNILEEFEEILNSEKPKKEIVKIFIIKFSEMNKLKIYEIEDVNCYSEDDFENYFDQYFKKSIKKN